MEYGLLGEGGERLAKKPSSVTNPIVARLENLVLSISHPYMNIAKDLSKSVVSNPWNDPCYGKKQCHSMVVLFLTVLTYSVLSTICCNIVPVSQDEPL